MTFGPIVIGIDGSAGSFEALSVAASLAGVAASTLQVVHAGHDDPAARAMLAAALDSLEGLPEDRVEGLIRRGSPAEVLAEIAERSDAGLIVVARGGDSPSHTPATLSHRAPCDLLVVGRSRHDRQQPFQRILIASDGSVTADRAARRGFDLARSLGAEVDLVFVGHPATGELITGDTVAVYGDGIETRVHLLEGDPALRILDAAAAGSDLVVVGNKGMTGLKGRLLGSVPRGVLEGAGGDVLVCRTVRQIPSELGVGEGGIIERHGEQLAAFVDETGELHMMSSRCTHLGCTVEWNPADRTFDCPCHGSRFGPSGEVVQGPAARPLPPA